MSWESSIKEFKYYLKVERSLADNSIQSYLRDINKLANYCRDIKKNEKSVTTKDIRNFISIIEKSIIETLNFFNIKTFSDKENIGIWYKDREQIKKVAAIGVRVKKWIAYHGFAININNNLDQYKKIIPCGIKDKGITNLVKIKKKDYSKLGDLLIEKFISNLKI